MGACGVRLFIDECLSPRIAKWLNRSGEPGHVMVDRALEVATDGSCMLHELARKATS